MRLLFENGGQTGVTCLEHLADVLTSRPHANTGNMFVNHDDGRGRILFKTDAQLTALIQTSDPETLAEQLWQTAKETAMNNDIDRLDQHARAIKDGTRSASDFGAMSLSEKLYIALAASSFELLQDTGHDIASALGRIGEEWRRELVARWG